MRFLKKENLSLLGTAGTIGEIETIIGQRMNWPIVQTKLSFRFESKVGKVYDVGDGGSYSANLVAMKVRGHYSLYRIIN